MTFILSFLSCFKHFKLKSVTVKVCPGSYTIPLFLAILQPMQCEVIKFLIVKLQQNNVSWIMLWMQVPHFSRLSLDKFQRRNRDATHDKPKHNANCLNCLLWKNNMSQNVPTTRRSNYVAAILFLSFNESVNLYPVDLHYLQSSFVITSFRPLCILASSGIGRFE